jgi:circadian clock protein KaiB
LDAPCEIIIYDVLKDFQPALDNRVLVTPTLIRVSPPPRVTILGNLSDTPKVVAALRRGGGER